MHVNKTELILCRIRLDINYIPLHSLRLPNKQLYLNLEVGNEIGGIAIKTKSYFILYSRVSVIIRLLKHLRRLRMSNNNKLTI
jgi:hypothetical protein